MTSRPNDTEFAPYYVRYVSLVPEDDILSVLESQLSEIARIAAAVDPQSEEFRYSTNKWSIREVFGHLIDLERVFGYRAFCIGRGETAPLPSFDENTYVAQSRYHERPLASIVAELRATRESNLLYMRWLSDDNWTRCGTASDNPVSVRALAFIIAGHARHHFSVLRDKYGLSPAP
jgi:hypothetical protein